MDLFAGRDERAEQARRMAVARLKDSVTRILHLDDGDMVMVTELACSEPGCPPLETVIAVLSDGKAPRQWKVHRAAADVDEVHLLSALLGP